MFCLEKLKVFDRALTSVANLAQLSANGDKRHAVVDQLMRASESVVLNLAEGVRLRGSPQRQHVLDYSIGSALECAACLDIARLKQLVSPSNALQEKRVLCEAVKMLYGLRRSWASDQLQEGSAEYEVEESWLFAHERLEAYQESLHVMEWFDALPGGAELSSRWFRQIDKASTSVVLNIAEGNGRRIEADHRNFLELAESSVLKVCTYIQLCERSGVIKVESARGGLVLLDRVALLVRGLARNT